MADNELAHSSRFTSGRNLVGFVRRIDERRETSGHPSSIDMLEWWSCISIDERNELCRRYPNITSVEEPSKTLKGAHVCSLIKPRRRVRALIESEDSNLIFWRSILCSVRSFSRTQSCTLTLKTIYIEATTNFSVTHALYIHPHNNLKEYAVTCSCKHDKLVLTFSSGSSFLGQVLQPTNCWRESQGVWENWKSRTKSEIEWFTTWRESAAIGCRRRKTTTVFVDSQLDVESFIGPPLGTSRFHRTIGDHFFPRCGVTVRTDDSVTQCL